MDVLNQIARFIRWKDWGPGKLTMLWGVCLYLALAYQLEFERFLVTFLVFMGFAASQSALGYVINNWADRDLDRRQLKSNPFNGRTTLESALAIMLLLLSAIVTGLPLILRPGFALLWSAWALASAAYSLEPVRLKTKGLVGLAVSFIAQWSLPVLLAFSAFEVPVRMDMWLLALAFTISGATLEIAHQRFDRGRDVLARAETFAVLTSDRKLHRLYALALLVDKLGVGVVVGIIGYALVSTGAWWDRAFAILLAVIYAGLLASTATRSAKAVRTLDMLDPYYGPNPGFPSSERLLHETLPNLFLPAIIGTALTVRSPLYGIVLSIFLFWRIVLGGADWRWPLRYMKTRLVKVRES